MWRIEYRVGLCSSVQLFLLRGASDFGSSFGGWGGCDLGLQMVWPRDTGKCFLKRSLEIEALQLFPIGFLVHL